MRGVSPGRAAAQDMDTNHGRLHVAMDKKFPDSRDIVAPSSGWVAEKWPLGAIFLRTSSTEFTSVVWGEAEAILMRADIRARASGAAGISAVAGAGLEQPGIAISRLSALCKSCRILERCDAGGGSRPQHQERSFGHVALTPRSIHAADKGRQQVRMNLSGIGTSE